MATRNPTGIERVRGRQARNRPRTHPTPTARKATKFRSVPNGHEGDPDKGAVLERLSRSISLVETIASAMQVHEDDPELGSIAEALDVACEQLRQAHGAVDLALRKVAP